MCVCVCLCLQVLACLLYSSSCSTASGLGGRFSSRKEKRGTVLTKGNVCKLLMRGGRDRYLLFCYFMFVRVRECVHVLFVQRHFSASTYISVLRAADEKTGPRHMRLFQIVSRVFAVTKIDTSRFKFVLSK